MNRNSIYTYSERTDRKYTVGFAVQSATRRLKQIPRYDGGVNVSSIGLNANLSEKITLERANEIADEIYNDSIVWWSGPR